MAITKPTRSMLSTGVSDSSDSTFLTADSSENATFAGNLTVTGNLTVSGTQTVVSSSTQTIADPLIELNTGAGSNANDLGFVFERGSTGDNACLIWDESADSFAVGTTTATGTSTGNMTFTAGAFTAGSLIVDELTINADTITATDDFIIDATTNIFLDADGGEVVLRDGGSNFGYFHQDSDNFEILSTRSNGDIIFKGNDGGSTITALTLDMSEAGTATFNHDIKLGDNGQIILGAGSDFSMYHDGSNTCMNESGTGGLRISSSAVRMDLNSDTDYSSTGEPAGILTLYNSNGSDGGGVNNYSSLEFNTGDGATSQGFINYVRTADNQGKFTFSQRTGSSSYAEALTILNDGKVGLGVSAPAATLHITTSTNSPMLVESTHGTGGYIELQLSDSGGAGSLTGYIGDSEALIASGTAADLAIRAQANFVVSTGGSTERLRIDSSGNVGIGGAPGALLDVNNGTAADNRTVAIFEGQGNGASQADGGQYVSITRTGPISNASANVCGGLLLANGSSVTGQANCGIRGTYEYNSGRDLQFFTSADNSTAPSNKMIIKGNGNVMIGAGAGSQKLEVVGQVVSYQDGDHHISLRATDSVQYQQFASDGEFKFMHIDTYPNSGANTVMTVATNREMSGNFNDTSDRNLKTNIIDLADNQGLDIINRLRPRRFDWKSGERYEGNNKAGFIAQEVQEVIPNAVSGEEYKEKTDAGMSVNVTDIVAHLTKAVQQLSQEKADREQEITNLENRIEQIEQRLI